MLAAPRPGRAGAGRRGTATPAALLSIVVGREDGDVVTRRVVRGEVGGKEDEPRKGGK